MRKKKLNSSTTIKLKNKLDINDLGYLPHKYSDLEIIKFLDNHKDKYMLDDNEEFIPRAYWNTFESTNNNFNVNLFNPIWRIANAYINENYISHSNILIIQDYSNITPYLTNSNYNITKRLHYAGLCDLVIDTLIELVPIDFSIYYPFRYWSYDINKESKFIIKDRLNLRYNNFVNFINRYKYTKIIHLTKPLENGEESETTQLLRKICEERNIEFVNIYDEEYTEKMLKKAKNKFGILSLRHTNFAKEKLWDIFNLTIKSNLWGKEVRNYNFKPKKIYSHVDFIKK